MLKTSAEGKRRLRAGRSRSSGRIFASIVWKELGIHDRAAQPGFYCVPRTSAGRLTLRDLAIRETLTETVTREFGLGASRPSVMPGQS